MRIIIFQFKQYQTDIHCIGKPQRYSSNNVNCSVTSPFYNYVLSVLSFEQVTKVFENAFGYI